MKRYIKILLVILLTFTLTTNVFAEVKTEDRNALENYGVSKKWKITSDNKSNVLNTPKVDAKEKIYDFENVLTEEEIKNLKVKIDNSIDKTGMDLVIVIKNLPYTFEKENETFGTDFYDYNDFGLELDKYSGTLLFRNTYEQNPYYDFYMFGNAQLYYRENDRNDDILDGIFDELHSGNYYNGFSRYIDYINNYYDSGVAPALKNYEVDENGYLKELPREYSVPVIFIVIFALIVTIIIISIMISKNKMIHKATTATDYLVGGSVKYTKKEDVLTHTHTSHYTSSSSSSSGGGSFHSSGGSSGGGHSSGGGRHG